MEEIIGLKFEQNSRDNLIFELFAKDEIKADLNVIKEEALKKEFKRLWVNCFCQVIKTFSDREYHIPATHMSNLLTNFLDKLTDEGYMFISCKYALVPKLFCGDYYLSNNDLL